MHFCYFDKKNQRIWSDIGVLDKIDNGGILFYKIKNFKKLLQF